MKLVDQSFEIISTALEPLQLIEQAGRTCYKSEHKITDDSAAKFVAMLLKRGHHSVIEHAGATARIITNRGVTHELVRHRLCSFSQESTRYVNYGGEDIEFIKPVWHNGFEDAASHMFDRACREAEGYYKNLLQLGWRPEQAREVLPNSLKTEIIVTANLREWRHIFKLRTSKAAHPQMRALMLDGLRQFQEAVPVLFDDINMEDW